MNEFCFSSLLNVILLMGIDAHRCYIHNTMALLVTRKKLTYFHKHGWASKILPKLIHSKQQNGLTPLRKNVFEPIKDLNFYRQYLWATKKCCLLSISAEWKTYYNCLLSLALSPRLRLAPPAKLFDISSVIWMNFIPVTYAISKYKTNVYKT